MRVHSYAHNENKECTIERLAVFQQVVLHIKYRLHIKHTAGSFHFLKEANWDTVMLQMQVLYISVHWQELLKGKNNSDKNC